MIKSVHFKNFKALIDATLPLSRFTLIVGPNGSGKSTAMQGLQQAGNPHNVSFSDVVTASLKKAENVTVEIAIDWVAGDSVAFSKSGWSYLNGIFQRPGFDFNSSQLPDDLVYSLRETLRRL